MAGNGRLPRVGVRQWPGMRSEYAWLPAVGMPNVSHSRRVFRRHTGLLPGDLRTETKTPAAGRGPET